MSTYEAAPATALLATHCAACGRPLLDAASVECGMGPVCRERAGLDVAPAAPGWSAAAAAVTRAGYTSAELERFYAAFDAGDARAACNALVARIAAEHLTGRAVGLVAAVRELGYATLAATIGARLAEVKAGTVIEITRAGDALEVSAPFSPEFNAALRTYAPGRRWDGARKVWRVPAAARRGLWTAFQAVFPGFALRVDGDVAGRVPAIGAVAA